MRFKGYLNTYLNENKIKDVSNLPNYIFYEPKLTSEAKFISLNKILVGPKFFKLPDKNAQMNVLIHEIGHEVSDQLLKNGVAWDWLDKEYFIGNFNGRKIKGINGHTTPGEIIAEAYSIYFLEPKFLKDHYISLYNELKSTLTQPKFKKVINTTKDLIKKMDK